MHGKWNEIYNVLIPKIKSPKAITHYRPISLINFSYKIVSKIMVNRLKPIINLLFLILKVLLWRVAKSMTLLLLRKRFLLIFVVKGEITGLIVL